MGKCLCLAIVLVSSLAWGCAASAPPLTAPTGVPPLPQNYQEIVEEQARKRLVDPASASFRFGGTPRPCAARYANTTPAVRRGVVGQTYAGNCGVVFVNAKNRMGGYAGETPYLYVLAGGVLMAFDDIAMFDYDRKPWE